MLVPLSRHISSSQQQVPKNIAIFGSTGSIGKSCLELLSKNPNQFKVQVLTGHSNLASLSQQALVYKPKYVGIADSNIFKQAKNFAWPSGCELVSGQDEIRELATLRQIDVVLAAIVGYACLPVVLSAINANKLIALANKECLVVAGHLIEKALRSSQARIVPVDSEHSAIFQALQGQDFVNINRLILTASGGPFLNTPISELANVTPQQAMCHPRWQMGPKISIDSATMVNKALELIEAYWLFGVAPNNISVLIHPQSIIHSIVEFIDGVQIAQLSVPNMQGPISYAINYPDARMCNVLPSLNLEQIKSLDFSALNDQRFPAVDLARRCIKHAGNKSAVFNLANEFAVTAFLAGKLGFDKIYTFIADCCQTYEIAKTESFEELQAACKDILTILNATKF